jgi:hypothetical protein
VLQKRSAHDERQRELLDRAMKALNPRDSSAASEQTKWIAKAYRDLVRFTGSAKKFSALRTDLKQQSAHSRKLARSIELALAPTEHALYRLLAGDRGVDQEVVDGAHDSFRDRADMVISLRAFADRTDQLIALTTWPKGGRWNVAKSLYGPHYRWLAEQCLKTVFSFGNPADIRVTSPQKQSPFGQYAEAVYELATGEFPDGVALEKAVNEAARAHQKRAKVAVDIDPTSKAIFRKYRIPH